MANSIIIKNIKDINSKDELAYANFSFTNVLPSFADNNNVIRYLYNLSVDYGTSFSVEYTREYLQYINTHKACHLLSGILYCLKNDKSVMLLYKEEYQKSNALAIEMICNEVIRRGIIEG